jgi:hypothetical protein
MSWIMDSVNEVSSWFSSAPRETGPVTVPIPEDYQNPYTNLPTNPMLEAPIAGLPNARLPKEMWTPEQKAEQLAKERAEYDKALAEGDVAKVREMARQIFEDQQSKHVYNDMSDEEFQKYLKSSHKFQDDAVRQAEGVAEKRWSGSPEGIAERKQEEARRRKAADEERARINAKMTPL